MSDTDAFRDAVHRDQEREHEGLRHLIHTKNREIDRLNQRIAELERQLALHKLAATE